MTAKTRTGFWARVIPVALSELFVFLVLIGLNPAYLFLYDLSEDELIPAAQERWPEAEQCAMYSVDENRVILLNGNKQFLFCDRYPLNGKYRMMDFLAPVTGDPVTVQGFWASYRLDLTGEEPVVLEKTPFAGTVMHPPWIAAWAVLFLLAFAFWVYLQRTAYGTAEKKASGSAAGQSSAT